MGLEEMSEKPYQKQTSPYARNYGLGSIQLLQRQHSTTCSFFGKHKN